MNGRAFDAQVVQTDKNSKRGKLLQQFVCCRLITLKGIDVGLFEFDRHNALYYFILNADEEIYLRYGGRDAKSAMSYLNLRSLEVALQKGLELHADKNWSPTDPRPQKILPNEIPLLADRTIRRNACVECHLIADYQTVALEKSGQLNRMRDLFVSPDIKTIGIYLDVPQGLVIEKTLGPVQAAGILAGDTITRINGKPVYTFGDLQYRYGKVDRTASSIKLTVLRDNAERTFTIKLPRFWWRTETGYRYWTVEPILPFDSEPLSDDEKKNRQLPPDSFASRISDIDTFDDTADPSLEAGDILLAVNGVDTDEIADTVDMHIKLRYSSGTRVKLTVERDGKRFISSLYTFRQNFRKPSVAAANFSGKGSTAQNEVTFEAKLIGDYLVIWATHSAGWHTYAMDNERRAREAAGGKKILGVEQGLSVSLSGGLKRVSDWRQTRPKEFSDLGQKWFSFGFDGKACLACKVESTGVTDAMIHITGQTCDSETCRPVDVRLRLPNVKSKSKDFDISSLEKVRLK